MEFTTVPRLVNCKINGPWPVFYVSIYFHIDKIVVNAWAVSALGHLLSQSRCPLTEEHVQVQLTFHACFVKSVEPLTTEDTIGKPSFQFPSYAVHESKEKKSVAVPRDHT